MTCSRRDECGDIGSLRIIGNAMRRKLDDQDMELRRQAARISFMEDMVEASNRVTGFTAAVAVTEFLVIVIVIARIWAGGPVA